ncbi:MAG TPA: LPS export ABC transporter permease LptF [Alphaproteobacteria bacterium]|nr:LPS export ABC transporter permease LptF [Alphaproteobacteria bacterium]
MKAHGRYILKQLLVAMLFVSFCLTCAIWLTQSLRFVELIVDKGISFGTFLYLTALLLPSFLAIVLPIALFSSVLFTYNKLWMDRELVVLRSIGVSQMSLALPALAIAGVVLVAAYAINLYFLPASYRDFRDLEFAIHNNFSALLLQEGKFNTIGDGLTVYVRSRVGDGELAGILVEDMRNPKRPVTYTAERGELISSPDGPRVVLFNGNRQEVNPTDGRLSILYFDRYSVDLSWLSQGIENQWRRPQERFLGELLHPNMNDANDRFYFGQLIVEAHQRLVSPFYAFTFTLIGLAALLSGDFSRQGQTLRVLVAILCVVFLQAAEVGIQNVAGKDLSLLPLLYVNCFVPLALAALYLVRPPRRRPKAWFEGLDGPAEAAGSP